VIGSAEKKDGLYWILENKAFTTDQLLHKSSFVIVSSNSESLLWHKRLGYPSFSYLSRLYPNLLSIKESYFFNVNIVFLPNKHTTYLPHPHTPSKPFYLIHSDI